MTVFSTLLSPGSVLDDRYRIEDLLGKGGMGQVYAGRHEKLGRRVAIKILNPALAQSSDSVARFKREAQILAQLGHEHICDATDFGQTEQGLHYFVMPLLEGTSLRAKMLSGELTLGTLLEITSQILLGLGAAHHRKVVHRDLKPDNVFLSHRATGGICVKLLDFGIAKVGESSDSAVTSTGAIMGTAKYMSPEQARGASRVGPESDLYSLGVVLYEAATGRCPFSGANTNEILYRTMTAPLVPIGQYNRRLPSSFRSFVMRALARDPAARFHSAADMGQHLRALQEQLEPRKDLLLTSTREEDSPAPSTSASQATLPILLVRDSGNSTDLLLTKRPFPVPMVSWFADGLSALVSGAWLHEKGLRSCTRWHQRAFRSLLADTLPWHRQTHPPVLSRRFLRRLFGLMREQE